MDTRREQIIDIVKREFIGPDPINLPGMIQENGEEILTSDPPGIRYIAGILFPQQLNNDAVEEEFDPEENESEQGEEDKNEEESGGGTKEYLQDAEELLNLSNAFKQSAISMTVAISNNDLIHVDVSAGIYEEVREKNPEKEKPEIKYLRKQIKWNNDGEALALPDKNKTVEPKVVTVQGEETDLRFHVTYRYEKQGFRVFTFSLVNSRIAKSENPKDSECFFQTEFSITSDKGFSPLPEGKRLNIQDNDYLSNQMLYRDVKSYAVGHGCGTSWEEQNGIVKKISTAVFPDYEIKPIVPNKIEGVSLEMLALSDMGKSKSDAISELKKLCDKYEQWIKGLSTIASTIDDRGTAARHINNCVDCLNRMKDGVHLLETNESVLLAFQLMNRAMLLQQLHYNIPLQEWEVVKNDKKESGTRGKSDSAHVLKDPIRRLPIIEDQSTWPGEDKSRYGKWRPFQLAFVLINLRSMFDRTSNYRSLVDLIWFPTGGGKTEAYLGLSAYTIFIRRILDKTDSGTTILMRYTLRLLTSQQYERASSMICACEIIRKEKEQLLGPDRISIGLWVGESTSPNKMKDAIKAFNDMYKGNSTENPFGVLKCPWCGAQMGLLEKRHIPGYRCIKRNNQEVMIFQCDNKENGCAFSKDGFELPLYVVDDDIYRHAPTLVLGTVDKFAMLPFRPEAQILFGIKDGKRISAPDLIIQDELHLISGPLGSMVGHYETMIHELCTYSIGKDLIQPKVIASTATISRAAEQCHALYGCGKDNVKQFPPSGLNAGDSFFAVENKELSGRKYVGILASGSSSNATTMIRMFACLLYAGKGINVSSEEERDGYWTNVGYFNSIRELGQAQTWIKADIDEYLHVIYKRRREDLKEGYTRNRRYIYNQKELTSRVRGDMIPVALQDLGRKYPPKENEKFPVDVCLATNMISVGIDVPRLGMMTVAGQPKTTSEYIQATSRVGRNSSAPGLVFVVFNPGKPRDKSHYEQFVPYHSKIYCNVEPTSVTPFSAPLRERALHALIIGILRLEADKQGYSDPPRVPNEKTIQRIKSIIASRVNAVDREELDITMAHIDAVFAKWKLEEPAKYQDFSSGDELPLMFPAGTMRNEEWGQERGFPTPTSMRSVDSQCEAKVIENGYYEED